MKSFRIARAVKHVLPGLVVVNGGSRGLLLNPPVRIDDLSVLPIPDRSLPVCDYRLIADFIKRKAAPIMTSRGCPAKCNFCCASRMFPGGIRYRPVEQVATEIKSLLQNENIATLKIFCSTFTASRSRGL